MEAQNQIKNGKSQISICTWNINHFTGNDEQYEDKRQKISKLTQITKKQTKKLIKIEQKQLQKLEELEALENQIGKNMEKMSNHDRTIELFEEKKKKIAEILRIKNVDFLILQEVNSTIGDFFKNFLEKEGLTKQYECELGILLCSGAETPFYQETNGQKEYYVIFYNKRVKIKDTSIIDHPYAHLPRSIKTQKDYQNYILISQKDLSENLFKWRRYRPVVLRLLEIDGVDIFLGGVHTSPSTALEDARHYINGMIQVNLNVQKPWILVGDWNLTTEFVAEHGQDGKNTKDWKNYLNYNVSNWNKFLENKKDQLNAAKPQSSTGTHESGAIIDYCVVSNDFRIIGKPKVLVDGFKGVSDHYPVITTLEIQPTSTMESLSTFTYTMSDEPILLNGMKVLFDNPTPTTPVTLQPKQRGTNNGR